MVPGGIREPEARLAQVAREPVEPAGEPRLPQPPPGQGGRHPPGGVAVAFPPGQAQHPHVGAGQQVVHQAAADEAGRPGDQHGAQVSR